ncbi:tetratricopeptide repeat protein [Parapedobacter lycopersici]|uniref:tetratricopeptide repeat protein n=1 Tax=Parapedobacter lycopersici TaxID=1864939 RepID=UPI00214D57F2|nr:tetratricopeptide repeat protein [Parapedobacter lycopersici]
MMTTKVRIVVLLLALLLLIYAIYAHVYQSVALIIGGMGYLIWSHFREGTVFLASQAFQQHDFEKAQRLLADIKKPEYLRKKRRNYYEFMSGNLALKAGDYDAAERHFQIASRLPFRRPNDKAIILVNLANINLHKKDYERVRAYIAVARKLEVTSRIAQIINKIENEIPKDQS